MHFNLPVGGKVVAATALAGLAIATWFAVRTPNQYVSTAVMQFPARDLDELQGRLITAQRSALNRHSLTQILIREDVYKQERQTEPLEDIVGNMLRRAIAIRIVSPAGKPGGVPPAFALTFEYPDRYKAQAVARDLTSALSESMSGSNGPQLQVLDPPSLPTEPVSPRRSRIVIMGLIGGLVAGVLLVGVRRWPLIAACGAVAAVVAYGGSLLVPNRYVSTAVLTITDQDSARSVVQAVVDDAYLRSLIDSLNLYPGKRNKEPVDQVVAEMRNRDIRVSAIGNRRSSEAIAISYMSDASPHTAQAVTNELVRRAIEMNAALRTQSIATVIDPADLPQTPVAPNRAVCTLIGLFGGLLLGIAWAIMRRSHAPSAAHA